MCATVSSFAAARRSRAPGAPRSIATSRRAHGHAGAHTLQAVHDHDVAGLEAFLDHTQSLDRSAGHHRAVLHDVLPIHDEHELAAQVGADRAVVDEGGAKAARAHELQAHEQTGREAAVGVVEHRARADRAVVGVDLVVDEVETRGVRIALLIDEPDVHGAALGVRAVPYVLQEGLLVDVEVRVHGRVGHDRRQQRRAVDEVAGRDDGARHASGDRRCDPREREVQLRGVEGRARGGELRLCDGRIGFDLLGFLARRRVLREQPLGAIAVRACELDLRARAVALCGEAGDFGLERPRIDLEEQIALRDACALGESDGLDVARPRADAPRRSRRLRAGR